MPSFRAKQDARADAYQCSARPHSRASRCAYRTFVGAAGTAPSWFRRSRVRPTKEMHTARCG